MGCGNSRDSSSKGSPDGVIVAYDRRPKISVRMSNEDINIKEDEGRPRVVFILGGPGSKKGRIVDDLVNSYQFHFISGEDVVISELPKKVANAIKINDIHDIKVLLEEDPTHVTFDWIISQIEKRIERHNDNKGVFVIDFLPNLRYMLKMKPNIDSCKNTLQKFEEKYPVAFALNLAIPPDRVIKPKKSSQGEGGMKDTGGQGDEADASRTQKRADQYHETVKPILKFFVETQRLVTVDVACGDPDLIWNAVHNLLQDLKFQSQRVVNTVILFAFDQKDIENLDINHYDMERIRLSQIREDKNASVEDLLTTLSEHLDTRSQSTDGFVVDLSFTIITPENIKKKIKKPITFLSVEDCYLEQLLPGSPKNAVPAPNSPLLKAVSTLENEVYLFPANTDEGVCSRLAGHMAAYRHIL